MIALVTSLIFVSTFELSSLLTSEGLLTLEGLRSETLTAVETVEASLAAGEVKYRGPISSLSCDLQPKYTGLVLTGVLAEAEVCKEDILDVL